MNQLFEAVEYYRTEAALQLYTLADLIEKRINKIKIIPKSSKLSNSLHRKKRTKTYLTSMLSSSEFETNERLQDVISETDL